MSERADMCETCRFWDRWDEGEPVKVSIREFHERCGMPLEESKVAGILEILGKTEGDTWTNPDCHGCCRARSPQLPGYQPDEDSVDPCKGCWPFTSPGDWCGEHRPHCPIGGDPFPFTQLSVRARNVMATHFPTVATVDDLLAVGRYHLSLTRNCGETTMLEFDEIAEAAGVAEQWKKS